MSSFLNKATDDAYLQFHFFKAFYCMFTYYQVMSFLVLDFFLALYLYAKQKEEQQTTDN